MAEHRVAIIMGSESDLGVAEKAFGVLERFGLAFDVRVLSAHRSPEAVRELALSAEGRYAALYERHESTGRPLGPERFVVMLEKALDRVLRPRKRGRKARRVR